MGLRSEITARFLLLAGVAAAFALAWRHFNTIPLLVLGQPRGSGQLQREQEAPFFQQLASRSRLPLEVQYISADAYGLRDDHQLAALRDGRIDVVSLRFMQNMAKEPGLEGLDLPGMVSDFRQARQVVEAYGPTLDRYLQKSYRGKLLGVWSFGPQVMFCRSPLTGLSDIRGRRVRVASPSLGRVIRAIGAVPVFLSFNDTGEALSLGMVDCAVTSAASGHFAGWNDHSSHYFPLVFQFGFNGYLISLAKWNLLSPQEQKQLQLAFHTYSEELWRYSERQQQDSEACMVRGACPQGSRARLKQVPVSQADRQQLRDLAQQLAVPDWRRLCEQTHPGCGSEWDRTLAPIASTAAAERRP